MENETLDPAKDTSVKIILEEPSGPSKTERQWAMGCHLISLCGIVVPLPSANLLGPLLLWLLKREDGAFIDEQGKESLNFQITLLIYALGALALTIIGIGFLLLLIVAVFGFVCVIVAAIKASEGTSFRYPACIRFIK
jgi:uncharacterized Tic20 family protein